MHNCSNQDPEGSNGNVQGAGGTGVGLVCNGRAVQALALPVLNGRKDLVCSRAQNSGCCL